jgi:hypothetical protein
MVATMALAGDLPGRQQLGNVILNFPFACVMEDTVSTVDVYQ